MDCRLIQIELVAYQFGSIADEARDQIEAHLLECPQCLKGFLALKREVETAQAGPRPSPAARARLRRAVASELASRKSTAAQPSWWRRPLTFGFVAASATAAMIAFVSVRGQLQHLAELAAPEPTSAVHGPAATPATR